MPGMAAFSVNVGGTASRRGSEPQACTNMPMASIDPIRANRSEFKMDLSKEKVERISNRSFRACSLRQRAHRINLVGVHRKKSENCVAASYCGTRGAIRVDSNQLRGRISVVPNSLRISCKTTNHAFEVI